MTVGMVAQVGRAGGAAAEAAAAAETGRQQVEEAAHGVVIVTAIVGGDWGCGVTAIAGGVVVVTEVLPATVAAAAIAGGVVGAHSAATLPVLADLERLCRPSNDCSHKALASCQTWRHRHRSK